MVGGYRLRFVYSRGWSVDRVLLATAGLPGNRTVVSRHGNTDTALDKKLSVPRQIKQGSEPRGIFDM